MMTDERLAEIGGVVSRACCEPGDFTADLAAAVPELLAEVRRLRAAPAAVRHEHLVAAIPCTNDFAALGRYLDDQKAKYGWDLLHMESTIQGSPLAGQPQRAVWFCVFRREVRDGQPPPGACQCGQGAQA